MRIFLDANILFSAAKSDGAIRFLLLWLISANHELQMSPFVQEEAERNLTEKFPDALTYFEELRQKVTLSSEGKYSKIISSMTAFLPEKDQPVLQAAIDDRCDILLTGDKADFGKLYGSTVETVNIHSPRSLAELLEIRRLF